MNFRENIKNILPPWLFVKLKLIKRAIYRNITMISEIYKLLMRPIPLDMEVSESSYEEYWEKRSKGIGTQLFTLRHRFILVEKLITKESSVIDIGCGDGTFLKYLSDKGHDKIVGIDISNESVRIVQSLGISAYQMNILAGEKPSGLFDFVVCLEVIEHIADAEKFLLNLSSLLTKDGRIILSMPNVGYTWHRLRLGLLGRFPITNCIFNINEHVRFWTVKDFKLWAQKLGFNVISVFGQEANTSPKFMSKHFPGLWAAQVIYVLTPKG